jgi:hypothetical protein
LAGLLLLFVVLFTAGLHKVDKEKVSAFRTYYAAATAMREGQNPYDIHKGAYAYVYPPLYAFLCQPLARLSRSAAARVMLAVNCALLLASLLASARAVLSRLGHSSSAANVLWVALIASLIAVCPIFKELLSFQADFLILASFVLAIVWLDKRPVLAGCALAVGIAVKYLPLIALPYLLLRRRWLAASTAIVASVFLTMLPATSLGWSRNLHYLAISNGGLGRILGVPPPQSSARTHSLADPLNISVTSSLARFAAARGWPEHIALALTAAVFLTWLGLLLMFYRSRGFPILAWPSPDAQEAQPYRGLVAVEWAGLLTAAIAFAPNANLLLAIFPSMVLITLLLWRSDQVPIWLLPTVMILIIIALYLPMAVMGSAFTDGWNSLGSPGWLLLVAYILACSASLTTLGDRGRRVQPPNP